MSFQNTIISTLSESVDKIRRMGHNVGNFKRNIGKVVIFLRTFEYDDIKDRPAYEARSSCVFYRLHYVIGSLARWNEEQGEAACFKACYGSASREHCGVCPLRSMQSPSAILGHPCICCPLQLTRFPDKLFKVSSKIKHAHTSTKLTHLGLSAKVLLSWL